MPLPSDSIVVFEAESLTNWELTVYTRLTDQQVSGIHLSLLLGLGLEVLPIMSGLVFKISPGD